MEDEKLTSGVDIDDEIVDINEEIIDIDSLLQEIEALESRPAGVQKDKKTYMTSLIDPDPEESVRADIREESHAVPEGEAGKGQPKKQGVFYYLFYWVRVIVLSILIALLINHFLIANALIPSGSMETTIMTGDRIIGLRVSYWFADPERGDIVIFKYPDDESKLFIKRVIGLPGDKVEIIDGKVYINDSSEPLEEDYLTVIPKGSFGPYEVPEDSYFMLGDNRNVSRDSRYWDNTFVKKEKILAKAFFRYYPSFRLIK